MKFTLNWLKEYLITDKSVNEIADDLTNIGLEIEEVSNEAAFLEDFTVAKINEASPHPDSTKLQICKVNIGKEILQVICGAKNARTGIKIAFAKIGSLIPSNGMKIKKAKIAGIESDGMICSASELNIGADGDGIIEIDEQYEIGTKLSEIYKKDIIFDVNITPNRGDCLGVYGIARDLSALDGYKLKNLDIANINGQFNSAIKINIASDDCLQFYAREISGIKNCPSPKWLADKLNTIGQNSISAIVDITNYVMFCLNQPMHSYDFDKLQGNIIARKAKNDEEFLSLKDLSYKLSESDLVIADDQKILGIAGIMGGKSSITDEDTQNILLEAAFFDDICLAKTGRRLNLLSESRYRFERRINIKTAKIAIELATKLILEICGGKASNIIIAENNLPKEQKIDFNFNKIEKVLGFSIENKKIIEILENLDFKLERKSAENYQITIPTHRNDLKIEQDIIEEIARINGYNNIISKPINQKKFQKETSKIDKIRDLLINSKMDEIINFSFVNSDIAKNFTNLNDDLFLGNPISEDLNYMRPNLAIGLISAIAKNNLRDFNNLSFFEIGKIFNGTEPKDQIESVAGVHFGQNCQKDHFSEAREFDIFDVKKNLFDILNKIGFNGDSCHILEEAPKYYHPYKSATLKLGKNIIGYFGEIHPIILKKFSLKNKINIFEIFLDNLPQNNKKRKNKALKISDFQQVKRDFAFILNKEVKAGEIIKNISKIDRNLISDINIFDIYQGDKLEKGKKSIAFSVILSPKDKTLETVEIDNISNKIIDSINKIGGILRDGA
jgi:phenylalanyl-tRNA synthetase beta chain